ncbi:MAG: AraC family transcriptional regulator [Bacterioplanes sp.]|nr:AraC family transcriptional regulator [Bacterioplanes sp.]
MKLGDISVSYVELMVRAVTHLGADPRPILQQFQLDATRLSSSDARISIPRFMRLGHAFIQQTQSPGLGLLMGRLTSPTHLGLAGLLSMSSLTVKDAAKALADYEILSSFNARGRSSFSLESGAGVCQFYSVSPYNDYNHFVVDSVLAGWMTLLYWVSGRDDIIKRVEFEFPAPSYSDQYAQYFSCEVQFASARNALLLHDWALPLLSLHRCAATHQALKLLADRERERVRHGLSFAELVARALSPLLNGHTPTLDLVAQRMNQAPWTLRRRLNDEGVSFQQVLNDTRRDLAISYVRETTLTLGEIAYLLGFGSTTAFQRAFKRWLGLAPGQYRLQYQAQQKPPAAASYNSTASS